jgi:uncharacterized protein (TIGR03000 family)
MSKTTLLAIALVGLALLPATAWAQHRGGGGGGARMGGGGGGGAAFHGSRAGSFGTGTARVVPFNGRSFNNFGHFNGNGFARNRGWYGYGWGWPFGFGYGLGYGLGYGGYGGYGGYSGYGGYGYDVPLYVPYFSSSYMVPQPPGGFYGPPDSGGYGNDNPVSPARDTQGPMPRVLSAAVEIYLPNKDAELWFNGVKTQQAGQKRAFVTPDLEPGKSYSYEVRAKWMEDGKEFDQTRTVTVRSGAQVVFAFFAEKKEQLPPPVEVK